jgi:hypothetical protein
MDSEKYIKLEEELERGKSPNDEGPFYHHGWWEAYKGDIKGKIGGIVVGALMGAVLGGIVAGAIAVGLFGTFAVGAAAAAATAFAGLTGAGIIYGMVEFGEIGRSVGGQAAIQEQADARQAIRFGALEKKLDSVNNRVKTLSALVKNKIAPDDKTADVPDVDTSKETAALASYRKSHYAKLNGSTKGPIFWKVAAIGLAVGAAAGLILASGGMAGLAGSFLIETLGLHLTSTAGVVAASTTIMGLFGASFGINRDYFRKIFDRTDLWTKGLINHKKVAEHQEEAGKQFEASNGLSHSRKTEADVATAVAPAGDYLDYPASATFHRDRVIKASAQALQELDHTRATPH